MSQQVWALWRNLGRIAPIGPLRVARQPPEMWRMTGANSSVGEKST